MLRRAPQNIQTNTDKREEVNTMMTANGTEYTYLPEERETILRYDHVDKTWYAWSCIPKHINDMSKKGWELVNEDQYGAKYKAPVHAVKIMPAEKRKREMSEAQKAALARHAFTAR